MQEADQNTSDGSLRAAYYQYLADAGDHYGTLAAGVADGSTFIGIVADYFLVDQGYLLSGVQISTALLNQISVTLMDRDYQGRVQSNGAALTYQQIESYHQNVFGSDGLSIDCWTAYEPVTLLGASAWSMMLNGELLGSAYVFGGMFTLATIPLAQNYSPSTQQAYGQMQAEQQAASSGAGRD